MIWRLIQKLLGLESKTGQVPSLPNSPSESKKNSMSGQSVKKPEAKSPLEKLVDIAKSQIGVKEEGGNNNGTKIREYQSATNLKPASWPWCAAMCCWAVREWIKDKENVSWLGLNTMTPEQWRPKTAAAFGFISWAQSHPNTTKVLSKKAKPQAGDFVIFDFSHIGIVVKVSSNGTIQTVEGNTSAAGGRDSESGDGVWLKNRNISLVRNYVRIQPSSK